ncbi:PREDICTED: patatin-like protein 7 [Ipomoea nil]|uniref:patatin-like protein 7 n=1 Tax=Ipomoea nil TaxID=35883 RepID=UPI000900F3D6|nr:PREDICTED: patatin-like protein 7 [Ipomoea nil]XP_019193217.1 PREDICTED: patatin-like protein 7 [Ipomoea nil]XP_019193218.1 PREDICTED: patatin-like protein 7 [Ipomoea nil]XP_019193219.1 PREDICTED: patatin-like protein 7 [Ipomoea nil]XP_019193220.1 PREDICTED: patatin-like protein 7 [Ipomoea nil]
MSGVNGNHQTWDMQEPSVETDKLSYEIFSILESKFLFGYDDQKLWIPKSIAPPAVEQCKNEEVVSTSPALCVQGGTTRGKICVLSIDGGGMRSILCGKALAYLEQALKAKSGNPDARICDYFDVAAGSGVGGIFTAMLFGTKDQKSPIFNADGTWKFLAENGKRLYSTKGGSSSGGGGIFRRFFLGGGGAVSAAAGIEKAMKEAFTDEKTGRSLTLKDTLKPVLIPCYDLSSTAPFLFSRADALESDSFDFRLWEVCRATSAEPGVFEPVCMSSVDGSTRCVAVDGGLAMTNPTAAAITHVLHNKQEFPFVRGVEDILVLSLGTGQQLLEGSFPYDQVKEWKAKNWARPMARISGDGSADLVDHAVAMAFGQSRSTNYVRIQANGSSFGGGVSVDTDPSPSNVRMLVGVADEMLAQKNVESVLLGGKRIGEQSNSQKLDWFAGELVQEHQRRTKRLAPIVTIKKATPK